jgi:hypothetical protein
MPTLIGLESDHEEPPCFEEGPQWEPEEPESSNDDAPAPQETWMGDSWFSAELLEAWHAAERDVGLSNTVQKQKARSKDLAHWCWVPDQAFVKSAAFRGEHAGYTFSTGASGTGYYKVEAARGARPTAEILKLDLLIASSRCTPSLMAGIEPVLLCRQRQARRARGPDGKRKKQKSLRTSPMRRSEPESTLTTSPSRLMTRCRWTSLGGSARDSLPSNPPTATRGSL